MKVYDSYLRELQEFIPLEGNKVKMYVCGPTVYDFAHLGHARCYITWDMVSRYLRFKGYDVTYVRNVTDVDDKIIKRAIEEKTDIKTVSEKYYKEFKKSMDALNILTPEIEPKATDTIKEMIDIIKTLVDKGFAYPSNGDVYFRVGKFEKYGSLSQQAIDDLVSGARVEASEIKENPLDFALWKNAADDEVSWNSPWGKGRPGWHIECSAMSKKFLGDTIDIHAGGQDLLFPHHENELAQSECSSGKQFVKYWMHNGFVKINNEKMSKSLKNFVTINELLKEYDSNTIRFFILTNHYRMPVEFGEEALNSAKAGAKRLKNAVDDIKNELKGTFEYGNMALNLDNEDLASEYNKFVQAMDEDFNTSKALASLFEIASLAQKYRIANDEDKMAQALYLLLYLSSILGFDFEKAEKLSDKLSEELMKVIISIRAKARLEKNFAMSDTIRDELAKLNITIKDTREGSSWSFND